MNKDYLTSPLNDKLFNNSVNNLIEVSKYNAQLINSVRATSSIIKDAIAPRKQMINEINNLTPKINTMVIAPELIKRIDTTRLISEDLQKAIISSQAARIPELTKNITQILDSMIYTITPNVSTYQTDLSKIILSIKSTYSDIDFSNSYQSIIEDQKICAEKHEINNTIDTDTEKNYYPVVQEDEDIKTLGVLLEKFITSYQKVKIISSHTYTLASENKIALAIYANSFTLLVDYIANITNPVLVSLSLSIITTVIIHLTDKNEN